MFETKLLKGKEIKNIFMRSATNEFYFDEDGGMTSDYLDYYEKFAKNEVGIIITGHAYVCEQGRASILQLNPSNNQNYEKFKELTRRVHEKGSRILMQLAHSGSKAKPAITKMEVVGPNDEEGCRGLRDDDMKRIIEAFLKTAKLAEETGFDGVQIHCAHGYLLSSFIDSRKNHRQDNYGGCIENRLRLVLDIAKAIKSMVAEDFIIAVKIDADTTSTNDFIQMGKLLETAGIDLIEVSGMSYSQLPRDAEAYWLEECKRLKENTTVPVAIVGGIYNKSCAQRCLNEGIDIISMSRPLISEPDLISKWKEEKEIASRCLRCGQCFNKERGKTCILNK